MDRRLASTASFLAFVAVLLGAFGAHALRDRITPADLAIWQTGVHYHLAHAVAVLFVALAAERFPAVTRAGWLFIAGIAIFSGSLYLLVLTQVRVLGAITPLGGLSFMGGWLLLGWTFAKAPKTA